MPTLDRNTGQYTRVGCIAFAEEHEADAADRNYRLNEYEVTRCYGGPEEGGWWYNLYEPTGKSVLLYSLAELEDAQEARDTLEAFASVTNRNENPRGIYSVVGGSDLCWMVETHPPERYPAERPHYE